MEISVFPKRGDIWWGDPFPNNNDLGIQSRMRPWIIVSNEQFNRHSPCVTAIPCTTRTSHSYLPVHVRFVMNGKENVARCEQVGTFSKNKLTFKVGEADGETMRLIEEALSVQLGLGAC